MTIARDRDTLAQYVRQLANEIGLRDWYLMLSGETPQDDGASNETAATCTRETHRKFATIRLRDDWYEWDDLKLRHICVHELLHCHMFDVSRPVEDMEHVLGQAMYYSLDCAVTHAIELAIDGIAEEWSRYLPTYEDWLDEMTGVAS